LSKARAEFAVSAYRNSKAMREHPQRAVVTVRAGNIIGGGDWAADRLFPTRCERFEQVSRSCSASPTQCGTGSSCAMPPADCCCWLRPLGATRKNLRPWNFGPVERPTTSVAEVADALVRCWGPDARWKAAASPGIPETAQLEIDSSKAVEQPGWMPKWPLDVALANRLSGIVAFTPGMIW
jgi:CDP-glucose 4,6-dehydratase